MKFWQHSDDRFQEAVFAIGFSKSSMRDVDSYWYGYCSITYVNEAQAQISHQNI
jgi:hypothetical protein